MDYCMAQNLGTLVWAANLAALELHTSLSNASAMPQPSYIVFDLDPGEPASAVECCKVALWVRDAFARSRLRSFAKTSGSKGVQVYVPLNSGTSYSETKPFAHELARALERKHPGLVVSDMKKELRGGKVLVDWSQNDGHKTTICVYSLRARPRPTVSTPVSWAEIGRCLESGNPAELEFTAPQVLERVERHGDLFAPVLSLHQQLPTVAEIGSRRGARSTAADERKPAQKAGAATVSKARTGVRKGVKAASKRTTTASTQRSA
jgi:bifunctional non-homologous end joining protein LigD